MAGWYHSYWNLRTTYYMVTKDHIALYHIVGKYGGGKVWQIICDLPNFWLICSFAKSLEKVNPSNIFHTKLSCYNMQYWLSFKLALIP